MTEALKRLFLRPRLRSCRHRRTLESNDVQEHAIYVSERLIRWYSSTHPLTEVCRLQYCHCFPLGDTHTHTLLWTCIRVWDRNVVHPGKVIFLTITSDLLTLTPSIPL